VLAPDFAKFALRLNAIPDRPVGPLPLAPHPQQGRMAGVSTKSMIRASVLPACSY
jgi:hypothetical protein